MSLSSIICLKGVSAAGETKILPADDPNHILIVQADKVVKVCTEDFALAHTWYASDEGGKNVIRGAVRSEGHYEKAEALIALEKDVILVDQSHQKLAQKNLKPGNQGDFTDRRRLTVNREIFDIIVHMKEHMIVFKDGRMEQLTQYTKQMNRSDKSSPPPVTRGQKLHGCLLRHESGVTRFFQIVESTATNQFLAVQGRLTLNSETGGLNIEGITRIPILEGGSVVSWDASEDASSGLLLAVLTNKGEVKVGEIVNNGINWNDVAKLDSPENTDIKLINQGSVCAVMYSKPGEDGGKLDLISVAYSVSIASAKLKTPVHRGRGLWSVHGRLYIVGGGKIYSCLPSDINTGLDAFIGRLADCTGDALVENSAMHLYKTVPKLIQEGNLDKIVDCVKAAMDLPEQLLIDIILFVLNSEKDDRQIEALRLLLCRDSCEAIISSQLQQLDINQALDLLEITCQFLEKENTENEEARFLSWANLILNSHYIRILLSKDNKTLSAINKHRSFIENLQGGVQALMHSRSLVHGMANAKLDERPELNQPYFVEIIQL